ncbi:hypothetical protein G7B40_041065 [Aetokthonos hydrillicola Thurmond2011]|jgi:hypothetical protein|uniref:Uncharacterized protein n=1 Tax=Aetokthonos hydrillicola Thurmond2011 TaxID=2712845 RepID=A0AAP5IFP5_9CYAN|nr:hypothetical protein [Aetokthonos hydrillicola]MBO3463020.1 hypothetical protein [Aetokthonos hydrillicola CCALA 1050]MBW4590837.1 hypothetical protein [Aetokthonos hydrillicola CCALA 1050]MDR9900878.1 hypothetical protein [Aetokthonos hydrillicola Thurmond2011]
MNKSERVQLSLRFDNRKELLDAVKARAKELNIPLVDFVALALEKAIEDGLTPLTSQLQVNGKIEALEARIVALEESLGKYHPV